MQLPYLPPAMVETRDLHRMPRGERCPDCGSHRWYLQDGLRFCSKGHQIEGFIQFDVGEDHDSGQLGSVTRKRKDIKEKERRQLSGQEGKNLYLEALQLLLRTQVLWLINEKGHGQELETIVRDLWDLRTRGSGSPVVGDGAAEGHLEMFTSQEPSRDSESPWKLTSRAQDWNPHQASGWPMPRLSETIALCYLGCLLQRDPLRLGQMLHWVTTGVLPYRAAFHQLPREMQDRMPSPYVKLLKLPLHSSLSGDELYRVTMDLTLSYCRNYDLVFPELNFMPMLVQYTQLLSLPIESIIVAKRLASCLGYKLSFPTTEKSRILPLDHPEVLLIALLIVATRLCFPFRDYQLPLCGRGRDDLPQFDWKYWESTYLPLSCESSGGTKGQLEVPTPSHVARMADDELDSYLASLSSLLDKRNDTSITRFFPVDAISQQAAVFLESTDDVNRKELYPSIQPLSSPWSSQEVNADGQAHIDKMEYETFRQIEDLTPTAAAFYKATGDAAGIALETVVRAVYMLERRLALWRRDDDK